jgi:hypothetical protein
MLYHSYRGFGITWPWTKLALCATWGGESREPCKSSPIKISLISSSVWGNAGRPQVASLKFGGEVVIKG